MFIRSVVCSGLAFAVAFAAAPAALANCAMPVGYAVHVDGNKVVVCPENFGERVCPDGGVLLRQDPSAGTVVQLPNRCTADPYAYGTAPAADSAAAAETPCYIDECVQPGTYRYGYAEPYACHPGSCGTFYYAEVAVTEALGACTPTNGAGTPAAGADVPWGKNDRICDYAYGGDEGPFSGCGVASPAVLGVFGAQAGLLLAGLGLLVRRRLRRRDD